MGDKPKKDARQRQRDADYLRQWWHAQTPDERRERRKRYEINRLKKLLETERELLN